MKTTILNNYWFNLTDEEIENKIKNAYEEAINNIHNNLNVVTQIFSRADEHWEADIWCEPAPWVFCDDNGNDTEEWQSEEMGIHCNDEGIPGEILVSSDFESFRKNVIKILNGLARKYFSNGYFSEDKQGRAFFTSIETKKKYYVYECVSRPKYYADVFSNTLVIMDHSEDGEECFVSMYEDVAREFYADDINVLNDIAEIIRLYENRRR